MIIFLVIVGIVILILFIIGKNKSNTSSTHTTSSHSSGSTFGSYNNNNNTEYEGPLLYKQKGIKSFEMKGMFYRDLTPEIHSGSFFGFAQCEDNSHDQYAVGIYNTSNELLGYTPQGNRRLNNSLRAWNEGKVPAWGSLYHDDYNDRWSGLVYIPVGFPQEQTLKFEKALSLIAKNQEEIRKKEKSTVKYFEILTRHKEIVDLLADLSYPSQINYSFPKNLLPTISKHLEEKENWEKLVELEHYQDLISELSDKFRVSTLDRIEKAKNHVA